MLDSDFHLIIFCADISVGEDDLDLTFKRKHEMYSSVRAGLELSVSELRPLRVQDIIHSHSLGQETSRDEGESVISNSVSVSDDVIPCSLLLLL